LGIEISTIPPTGISFEGVTESNQLVVAPTVKLVGVKETAAN